MVPRQWEGPVRVPMELLVSWTLSCYLCRVAASGCSVDTCGPEYSVCSCSRLPACLLCGEGGGGGLLRVCHWLSWCWGGVSQRASVSLCGVWSPPGEGICSPEHVVGSEQGLGWKGPLEPSGPIPRHEQRRGPLCFSVVLWVGGWPLRTRPARPPRGSVGDHYDHRPSWCHGWRC